jgi:transcriptional regulator with XRE-family HTH domain
MLKALGDELRRAREERGSSLQAIAGPANITATYLQKLERGVVETPSPRVLARLASVLGTPYLHLMELAGYLDEGQRAQLRERAPQPHPLAGQALSSEEWRAVAGFIRALKAKRGHHRQSRPSRQEPRRKTKDRDHD